jgi:hypothetical protein
MNDRVGDQLASQQRDHLDQDHDELDRGGLVAEPLGPVRVEPLVQQGELVPDEGAAWTRCSQAALTKSQMSA